MPADPRIAPLVTTLRLNGQLYENCFREVTAEQARHRPASLDAAAPALNSMAFLGAHLADSRRYLANLLGPEVDNPFPELADGRSNDDFPELPEVGALIAAWRELGEVVEARMEAATPEMLAAAPPFPFPVADPTLLGALAFLVHHEGYHVGQLAYLRRLVGLGPMAYR